MAKVNGESVTEEDLRRELDPPLGPGAKTPEAALDKVLLFRLSVQDARRQNLDQDPEVKREMEKALYRVYLERKLRASAKDFEISDSATKEFYNKHPLLKIRHLVLPAQNETQKKESERTLHMIEEALHKGAEFKSLVIRFSKDESASRMGDLDFRGLHNLHEDFYHPLLQMKAGQVSKPIEAQGAIHLFQLVDKKPYSEAPAVYLEFLRARAREEKKAKFLASLLKDLKKEATIEMPSAEALAKLAKGKK